MQKDTHQRRKELNDGPNVLQSMIEEHGLSD